MLFFFLTTVLSKPEKSMFTKKILQKLCILLTLRVTYFLINKPYFKAVLSVYKTLSLKYWYIIINKKHDYLDTHNVIFPPYTQDHTQKLTIQKLLCAFPQHWETLILLWSLYFCLPLNIIYMQLHSM